jgi:hypothetical protein
MPVSLTGMRRAGSCGLCTPSLAGLRLVGRVGGQDAVTVEDGIGIGLSVLGINGSPTAL